MLEFDKKYSREAWVNFFGYKFNYRDNVINLFNVFTSDEKNNIENKYDAFVYIDRCSYIGDLNIEGEHSIPLYEVYVRKTRENTKIKLFKLAVDIIRGKNKDRYGDAIFFFIYDENDSRVSGKYRLSYVNYGLRFVDGKIKKESTNPKRYSFLLGVDTKTKTARQRLTINAFESVSSIIDAFSVEGVNKEFYKGVKDHFNKINKDVFPILKDDTITKNFSLRFLGRILFCWFLKEKDFIPKDLFNVSLSKDYYKNVLYDLFFNVLNCKMNERESIRSEIIKHYEGSIPFLNGGLFSVHKEEENFFGIEDSSIKSLFDFFNMYNFTVDESSTFDEEVSIDPEMLGRIFENLLAEINPETEQSARKETGSFYTPREIVDYMITSSIILYLKNVVPTLSSKLDNLFSVDTSFEDNEKEEIIKALQKIKILDPACGSGAFPIGVLQRLFYLIDKLDPTHKVYKEEILNSIPNSAIRQDMEDLFKNEKFNYAYKLDILQTSIYGVDIQPIAIEISRLRAFLSLIVDESKNCNNPNFGIKPLPNLEFQFICANSLVKLKCNPTESIFVEGHLGNLRKYMKEYFLAHTPEDKIFYKSQFEAFREQVERDDSLEKTTKEFLLSWKPFENSSSLFFDKQLFGVDDNFDIVIGNPPYIQLQGMLKEQKAIYQNVCFETFASTGDIYQLFYEKSLSLLSDVGISCLITSNKWMRAGYGKSTREYFYKNAIIHKLLDLGAGRFNSATVDVNIIAYSKSLHNTKDKKYIPATTFTDSLEKLKNVEINNDIEIYNDKEWVVMTETERSIFNKINKHKALKDWDINIYRGVVTGYNDAFIIYEETKNKLIKEDKKSAEVIKPLVRGRDIKRYSYTSKNIYLLFIPWHFPLHKDTNISGASEKAEKEFKKQYPAVYNHLLKYKKELSNRNKTETGIRYEWYALQRCANTYYEEFEKDKIVWASVGANEYSYVEANKYLLDTNYFLVTEDDTLLKYLIGIFNSKLFLFALSYKDTQLGEGGAWRHYKYNLEEMCVPEADNKTIQNITNLVEEIIALKKQSESTDELEKKIDKIVYELYGLNDSEISVVENT